MILTGIGNFRTSEDMHVCNKCGKSIVSHVDSMRREFETSTVVTYKEQVK